MILGLFNSFFLSNLYSFVDEGGKMIFFFFFLFFSVSRVDLRLISCRPLFFSSQTFLMCFFSSDRPFVTFYQTQWVINVKKRYSISAPRLLFPFFILLLHSHTLEGNLKLHRCLKKKLSFFMRS